MKSADLRAWRTRMRYSKAQAARELGIARRSLFTYESGDEELPRYIGLACAALEHGIEPL